MRRLLCLLLCLLVPAAALAAPLTPYPAETLLRYSALSASQQALVDCLYTAALAQADSYQFAEPVDYGDLSAAMALLSTDFPELFHLSRRYAISYPRNDPDTANAVSFSYEMDKAQADRLRGELLSQAASLAEAAQGAGDKDQQVLFLHDALCQRIDYSTATGDHHAATAALLRDVAACEGYAQALSLTCRLAGIPCSAVSGTVLTDQPHAWNALLLDGVLCFTDATMDDQPACLLRDVVNVSLEELCAAYQLDESILLPWPSDDTWEYHRRQGSLAASDEEATAIFRAQLRRLALTGEPVRLRFATRALCDDFLSRVHQEVEAYNAAAPEGERILGAYSYLAGELQPCLCLYQPEAAPAP